MTQWAQGKYTPKNPQKYIGKGRPKYRSSWEKVFMEFCDSTPEVLQWACEAIRIEYMNPVKGAKANYTPDFLVVYQDAKGNTRAELIEIKPTKETTMEAAGRSTRDKLMVAINQAKWAAARAFCAAYGLTFKVVTEQQMFQAAPKYKKVRRKK